MKSFAPDKILVIQLRRIGDVILTTPAVKAIRKTFPNAVIDFLVEPPCHEVLQGNPYINEILIYDKNSPLTWIKKIQKRNYDTVIDFLGNPRSAIITLLSKAKVRAGSARVFFNFAYNRFFQKVQTPMYAAREKVRMLSVIGVKETKEILPEISLSNKNEEWADNVLKEYFSNDPKKPKIAFAPGARRITRRWPEEHYARLAKLIEEKFQTNPVILWGPGEKGLAQQIVDLSDTTAILGPKTETLKQLAAFLSKCDMLICNSNGASHIATAVNCPTLIVYGSSKKIAWTPDSSARFQGIQNSSLSCVPCESNKCSRNIECLNKLSPQTVLYKMIDIISTLKINILLQAMKQDK
jgi:lipopolysaccharide heptosyltransferase II